MLWSLTYLFLKQIVFRKQCVFKNNQEKKQSTHNCNNRDNKQNSATHRPDHNPDENAHRKSSNHAGRTLRLTALRNAHGDSKRARAIRGRSSCSSACKTSPSKRKQKEQNVFCLTIWRSDINWRKGSGHLAVRNHNNCAVLRHIRHCQRRSLLNGQSSRHLQRSPVWDCDWRWASDDNLIFCWITTQIGDSKTTSYDCHSQLGFQWCSERPKRRRKSLSCRKAT